MKARVKLKGKVYNFEADTAEELGDKVNIWLDEMGIELNGFVDRSFPEEKGVLEITGVPWKVEMSK